jgi:signal transduction histidine kinase
MRGYLRLLEQQGTELSEPHQHAVTAALRASARATDLLTQVSTLARFYRGEVSLNRRPVALEPLLRAAMHAVALPPEPIVTLHVIDIPPCTVLADDELLRSAVAHVTTAVVRAQAMDARVILQAAAAEREGADGIAITISSSSNPDGAAGATSQQVFDIMRGGLGIDLPIAAFLIAAHGGVLHERRQADRFAGATLWLPLAVREPQT